VTAPLRLLLVDDHAILREGLVALVEAQGDMKVVAQAGTGREAVQQAELHRPDVMVIDVSMPDMGGADAVQLILQAQPGLRVVALTRHADAGYIQRMFKAGVSAYVLKRSAGDALISAIRAVAAGRTWIDPDLAGDLMGRSGGAAEAASSVASPSQALTDREEQVLKLIAWGQSNKEVAIELGLSIKTVEYYKATALEKLGMRSRTDIVRHALSLGWLDAESGPR
jgi:two-component system response regulator NreC